MLLLLRKYFNNQREESAEGDRKRLVNKNGKLHAKPKVKPWVTAQLFTSVTTREAAIQKPLTSKKNQN
jgi:hypothetical protein